MAKSHDVNQPKKSRGPSDAGESGGASARRRSPLWSVVLAVGFAALVGFCCLCGGLLYRQWPSFHADAAAAEALTRQMLTIDVPAPFEPQGTVEWRVWWLLTMRGAYYAHTIDDGELSLLEVDSRFLSQPEVRQHVVDSLYQQGAGSGFDLNVLHTETRTFDVSGEKVAFRFMAAEDRSTGEGRRLVDGVVNRSQGRPVLVALWLDEDVWDEEMVAGMIESIGPAK